MNLVCLMPVRNEAWCLGLTARAALMWCDTLVCLNHASTDASSEILREINRVDPRVVIIDEPDPKWDEMAHRQTMLCAARKLRASHIAIIDADEIVTGNLNVRALLEPMPYGSMLNLPGYNLRGRIDLYHANGVWGRRWFSCAFRDDASASWTGDTFHHREPHGLNWRPYRPVVQGQGGIMHLWGVSERRLRAKHALYKITERLRWPDKLASRIETEYNLWRSERDELAYYQERAMLARIQQWNYDDMPGEWWIPYKHLMKHLHIDAEPWQEEECRRLVAEHGHAAFVGLDLFGVV